MTTKLNNGVPKRLTRDKPEIFHLRKFFRCLKIRCTVISGAATAGIGFGLGCFLPGKFDSDGVSSSEDAFTAVTFHDRGNHFDDHGGSAAAFRKEFGIFSRSSFSAAKERLAELVEEFEYHRRTIPGIPQSSTNTNSERLLEEIEHILSQASEEELGAFLQSRSFDDHTDAIAQIAYGSLARISPERAAQLWLDERDSRLGFPSITSVMREWLQRDPGTAAKWVAEHAGEEGMEAVRATYYTLLAGIDPEKALDHLSDIDPKKGFDFAYVLGETLDPALLTSTVERFLEERGAGTNTGLMISGMLAAWGAREPDAMLEWLFARDLDELGKDVVRDSLEGMIGDAPEDFLDKIGPALAEQPALRDIASLAWWRWLARTGKETEAINWLSRQENTPELMVVFDRNSFYGPSSHRENWPGHQTHLALGALMKLPESTGRDGLVHQFLQSLTQSDPQKAIAHAMEHMPVGFKTDIVFVNAVSRWARSEPETAIRWSLENLESDFSRRQSLDFAFSQWMKDDPDKAISFIAANPEIPEAVKKKYVGNTP